MFLLQPDPIVVDLARRPEPTPDIAMEIVLEWWIGRPILFVAAAALGCVLVAVAVVAYKRWRDATTPPAGHSHTTLHLSG